jgi:hypothetical protein
MKAAKVAPNFRTTFTNPEILKLTINKKAPEERSPGL